MTSQNSFDLSLTKPILLFDGVCNLCNHSVQAVIKIDPNGKIQFASLQSEIGQQLLKHFNLPEQDFDTVILVEQKQFYTRSDVPLRIFKTIGGWWQLLYIFKVIPKFIRDAVYNFIAQNRYQWFGKEESCWLPTPDLKGRFLG